MKLNVKQLILTLPICLSVLGSSALAQAAGPDEATLAKRAKAYGALAHLPASTEGAVVIRNLNGVFDEIVKSNVFARVLELSGAGGDGAKDAIAQIRQGLATYAGEEIVLAYSEGSAAQVKHLMSLYDIYVRMTYGALGRGIGSGDFNGGGGFEPEMIMGEVKKSLADANSPLSKAIDQLQMPPILLASKMPDAAEALVAQIDEFEDQLPPFIKVSKFEAADTEFKSWAIDLNDVFDKNAQAGLEEAIGDKAISDRIAKAIRGKRIELSVGAIGGYLVVGLGRNHAHLNFVEDAAESLVALPQFAHLDPYIGKPIHGVAFAKKALLASDDSNKMIKTMADSFVDGLTAEGSPTMKKVGGKLKKVANQMMKLNERKSSDYIGIMYGGNGLHGEGFGGWLMNSLNGKAKLKFANADLKDAFMIFDSATKPKYNKIGMEMMETLASMVPLGMRVYGEMSGDDDNVEKFMEMQKMFGPKLEKIWGIMSTKFFPGLGEESAMIVDLNGSLPKIPTLPRALVNKGKAPRIALANTVKDRKLLSQAWEELVPAVNDLLAAIPGQEAGAEVQIPDAISSNKDGLATHYFGMPFLSNDFMPSLSISDKLFFLSTSKTFSESIAAKVGKGNGDLRGAYFGVNFNALNQFAEDWLQLVLENKDTVFDGNEFAAEDFEENSEMAKQILKLTRALKSFEYNKHATDANEARSSWHLHLEDVK